jgi:predicted permease
MTTDLTQLSNLLGMPVYLIIILLVWIIIWKALALWKSARRNQPVWFIVLLVVNTMGILEILYIFLFADLLKVKQAKRTTKKKKSRKP